MSDPQPVIQTIASAAYALIVLLVPVLIKLLYPQFKAWLDARVAQAQTRLSREQLWAAGQAAAMAVQSVEQRKKTGGIVDNQHAFDTAAGIVETWLRSRGIVLDTTELRAAIESAVNDLPHETLKPTAPMSLPSGDKWE